MRLLSPLTRVGYAFHNEGVNTLTDRHQQSLLSYYIPSQDALERLASFYGVFSDPTRVKILSALSISELCVTDIARFCRLEQTTVSHQLRILKSKGLVASRREGKIIYYAILTPYVAKCLEVGSDYLARH